MWYALKCHPGKEQEILESCRQEIDSRILCDAFLFTYDQMKRYEGSWHVEKKQMFPQYVFLETKDGRALLEHFKFSSAFPAAEAKENLKKISSEEERFLQSLYNTGHHLPMSEGYIRDGQTHVTCGPLVGWERQIKKIDRHKRLAKLAFPGNDFVTMIPAGLEIKSKS
ncbi:hypothetical protein EUBC25_01700 [Claveliimonas bilis]|uniref:transcription termination/antitermination NusG family protein n=1 Tax=Claveliimonas bilis TaxID=3028070 RepID=UPI001E521D75|nr:transcription termination/antitermination NusG family protein [Claveliimonas bilis]BCZ26083.1 hypothetical protein EUBC25_01700 [Claveliimonas bilis]